MTTPQELTAEEAIERLRLLGTDAEVSHGAADEILLALLRQRGLGEVADEWQAASDRCGGFWYA